MAATPSSIIALITIAVVVGFIIYTFNSLLLVATPNQVMVLAGGKGRFMARAWNED